MRRKPAYLALVLGLSIPTIQPVFADPITFDFSGTVHQADGIAPQSPGDLFAGILTVDPDRLVTPDASAFHRRFDGPVDLQVSFSRPPDNSPVIAYNLPSERMDLVINNNLPYDAFRAGFSDPDVTLTFGFYFINASGTAFQSTDFPRELNLPLFDEWRLFYADYWVGGPDLTNLRRVGGFLGTVTSWNGITAPDRPTSPVPEPASLFLIGSAMAGICARRIQQRRGRTRRS